MRFLLFWLLRALLAVLVMLFRLILFPTFIVVLRLLRSLVFLSFSATTNGPAGFINRLAGEWTERIVRITENRDHINEVFQFCRILAGTIIVLGWLISGFFTYQILRVVFGFFT
jgi:hypothetical protein